MTPAWPEATLDPVRRARVLAAAMPGSGVCEVVLDSPYTTAWPWLADLEHSVPAFDVEVGRLSVERRVDHGDHEELDVVASTAGLRFRFDVRLEDGYCLMRSRLYVVVMGAAPEDSGERTRFVHVEAVPIRGAGVLRRLVQRMVDSDVRNIERLLS